ncbi:hypothetical protein E2C01_009449 [Portunus trituberculatus]|uniref:Uncharacterized protein n=1 Tax=Portunus trituberculatus TaxID=210409 RepID=A0A5B7D5T0_PORTR|nr:hypothetical protein [Portunus trituberculatus]
MGGREGMTGGCQSGGSAVRALKDLASPRALLIPLQLAKVEVFGSSLPSHPVVKKDPGQGIGPRILSIMAKCSLLSWVWKSVMPRYSSNMMHPMDHTSHG